MDALYSPDILALAASLKDERLTAPCGSSRKVSKLCGSELEIDLSMKEGRVTECALRVRACALGQAAAAIIQRDIIGATLSDIQTAQIAMTSMLKDGGDAPAAPFDALAALRSVADYPARHTSTLLAINAALDAARQCENSTA